MNIKKYLTNFLPRDRSSTSRPAFWKQSSAIWVICPFVLKYVNQHDSQFLRGSDVMNTLCLPLSFGTMMVDSL
jgi:hypothetical protein